MSEASLATGSEYSTENARRISLIMIVASMAVVTAKLADAPVLRSANDRSRWCTVWSIVERNSYQIDEIRKKPGWDTIDLVKHNGHFYSSKPPLLPRIVAELYRGLKYLTGWTLLEHPAAVTRILLFIVNILPMGFALWKFSGAIERYTYDSWSYLFILGCACWGVMLLPFLTVFNNHTVAASCFLIALPMAMKAIVDERGSGLHYFLCGILTAFGVCNELPAALFGLCLFFMLLHEDPRKTLMDFVPGAIAVFILFFVTNYQATGSLQPFYSKYGTETYNFVHEGVPSYWMDPRGIDRPRDSFLIYLFHCTFGHHGIFSLSPIFLVTLVSWAFPPLYWRSRLRKIHLLGLALTLATLGFYLTKTENYNYGGVSVSLRWMMWLIPFWLVSMLPMLTAFGRQSWFRVLTLLLLAVSIFSAWYPSNSPWTHNWIFQAMSNAKWIDYSDPPPKFKKTHYTWIGALPVGPLQEDYSITFIAANSEGIREKLRLHDGGPVETSKRRIFVSRASDTAPETVETGYILDVAKFNAGRPVEDFLVERHDGTPISEADLSFFRGMPRRMQYINSRVRYEKTPLKPEAIRCQVGYTYVNILGEDKTERRYIRDIWYSEEVPFGVLKWEDRVEQPGTKLVLTRKSWTPAAVGKFLPREDVAPF